MRHTRKLSTLILISVVLLASGCEEKISVKEIATKMQEKQASLEKSRLQTIFEIITPHYIPEGYVLNCMIVVNTNNIAPEGQGFETATLNYRKGADIFDIIETIYESEPEDDVAMKGAEKISINGIEGKYLNKSKDLKILQWKLEGIEITLKGSLEKSEMLEIAESIQRPCTEFYILGPEGNAENYTTNYVLGESGTVIVGVVNHEYRHVNYTMDVRLENVSLPLPPDQKYINLENNDTWEKAVTITPSFEGTNMGLEFLLFNEDKKEMLGGDIYLPYRDLRLWINVSENTSEGK
jgi:hypothetical protein